VPFVKKPHFSDQCRTYTTTDERKSTLKNTCYLCLREGHTQKDCKSENPCFYCKATKRHHSALCPQKFGFQKPKEKKESNRTPTVNSPSTQTAENTTDTKTNTPKTGTCITKTQGGNYLTSIATVQNPQKEYCVPLRILLDCASPHSYITQKAAKILCLTEENHQLNDVGGFNSQITKDLPTADVTFQIYFPDDTRLEIFGHTTPAISKNVQPPDIVQFRPLIHNILSYILPILEPNKTSMC